GREPEIESDVRIPLRKCSNALRQPQRLAVEAGLRDPLAAFTERALPGKPMRGDGRRRHLDLHVARAAQSAEENAEPAPHFLECHRRVLVDARCVEFANEGVPKLPDAFLWFPRALKSVVKGQ